MTDYPIDIVDRIPPEPLFTPADRCDGKGCGAQAYSRAVFRGGSELLFCMSHFRRYEEVLVTVAVEWVVDHVSYARLGRP